MKLIVLGHNINTDLLHPSRYFSLDRQRVKEGFLRGIDVIIADSFRPGDILVGGDNFGCGSSRETTVQSMLYNNVTAVVAISFARIFYRNAVNNSLPVFCFLDPADYLLMKHLAPVEIDTETSRLYTEQRTVRIEGVPPFVQDLIGSRLHHVREVPGNV